VPCDVSLCRPGCGSISTGLHVVKFRNIAENCSPILFILVLLLPMLQCSSTSVFVRSCPNSLQIQKECMHIKLLYLYVLYFQLNRLCSYLVTVSVVKW
jgi:hypothetical protein